MTTALASCGKRTKSAEGRRPKSEGRADRQLAMRLLVHVEGETEESFVNEVESYLVDRGYFAVSARIVGKTRRFAVQRLSRLCRRNWTTECVQRITADSGAVSHSRGNRRLAARRTVEADPRGASRVSEPLMGTLAALEIGISTMRAACPQFANWLERLTKLAASGPA